LVHPRVAPIGSSCKLREGAVVGVREIPTDISNLLINDMIIVEKPLSAGGKHLVVMSRFRKCIIGPL
jgi:hypothetical protein